MSRLSGYLWLTLCLAIGPVFYVYGTVLVPREAPARTVSPETSKAPVKATPPPRQVEYTGSVGPQTKLRARSDPPPRVPGIRFAALNTEAMPAAKAAEMNWSPVSGPYAAKSKAGASTIRPAGYPAVRKVRRPRIAAPYRYRRASFRFAIGIYPGW
jgi:hypothetical protein